MNRNYVRKTVSLFLSLCMLSLENHGKEAARKPVSLDSKSPFQTFASRNLKKNLSPSKGIKGGEGAKIAAFFTLIAGSVAFPVISATADHGSIKEPLDFKGSDVLQKGPRLEEVSGKSSISESEETTSDPIQTPKDPDLKPFGSLKEGLNMKMTCKNPSCSLCQKKQEVWVPKGFVHYFNGGLERSRQQCPMCKAILNSEVKTWAFQHCKFEIEGTYPSNEDGGNNVNFFEFKDCHNFKDGYKKLTLSPGWMACYIKVEKLIS